MSDARTLEQQADNTRTYVQSYLLQFAEIVWSHLTGVRASGKRLVFRHRTDVFTVGTKIDVARSRHDAQEHVEVEVKDIIKQQSRGTRKNNTDTSGHCTF